MLRQLCANGSRGIMRMQVGVWNSVTFGFHFFLVRYSKQSKISGMSNRDVTCYARMLSGGLFRRARRRPRTTYGTLCIGNRHAHCLTMFVDRGLFRECESGAELVYSLLYQSTAHGNPEDDQLRRERLTEKGRKKGRLDSPLAYSRT